MPPIDELLFGGPAPFFVALLIVATLARGASSARRALGAALGTAAGYLVFHVYLVGGLWPPAAPSLAAIRTEQWLVWLVPIGAGVGALTAGGPLAAALQRLLPLALGLTTLAAVLYPKIRGFWDTGTSIAVCIGLALGWIVVWSSVRLALRERGSSLTLGVLTACSLAASVTIGMSGSQKYAQLLGASTAALFAIGLFAVLRERRGTAVPELGRGALGSALAVFTLLVLGGHFYAELDLLNALLLATPLLLVGPLAALWKRDTLRTDLVRMALACIPLAIALVRAGLEFREAMSASDWY